MMLIPCLNPANEGGWLEAHGVVKALVMAELARVVDQGGAAITALESGALELRLATGEIFHLGESTVTRVA
jgi:hypothetical protein